MKKVLICAFHFPPGIGYDGIIGALRPAKFAKYLPSFGWEPYILSAKLDVNNHTIALDDLYLASTSKIWRANYLDLEGGLSEKLSKK
ncbi:MAG: hypothetical protein QW087_07695 [Methanomassiliicoccales archaeon]